MSHYPSRENSDGAEEARELSRANFSRGDALSLLGFFDEDPRDESSTSTSDADE